MSEQDKRTELSDLGEFGLIDRIRKASKRENDSSVLGIGDDAAVIDAHGKQLVLSTDMLMEGIHFDLAYMPLRHLGFKAVAVNVSDIAAMNAVPQQITVSLGLSNRFSLQAIEELYEGIHAACEAYKVDLVGGDTTASRSGLAISITATGLVESSKLVKRSTAKVNEVICVTGDLGGAYVGLQVLAREKQVYLANPEMQPELKGYSYIVGRQLKPEARMDVIHELAEKGIKPTSMIDISDGLASELMHISTQSKVGARIYEANLPIDKETYDTAVTMNLDPVTCALNGGEDYELLFTLTKEDFEKVKNHPDISSIGYTTAADNGLTLVTKNDNEVKLKAQGWIHF